MSLHRRAAKRDLNEPEIISAFAARGWHVEQMSAAGMPDLLVFAPFIDLASGRQIPAGGERVLLVDVKGLGKVATPAQVAKWKVLAAKGIPVYVARTKEDVAAIVAGTAEAWAPERPKPRLDDVTKATKKRTADAGTIIGKPPFAVRLKTSGYVPPPSQPADAPALAAETFAPCDCVGKHTEECVLRGLLT